MEVCLQALSEFGYCGYDFFFIVIDIYTNAKLLHGTLKLSYGKNQEDGFINLPNLFGGGAKNSFLFSSENGIPKQSISLFLLWAGLLKQTEKKVLPIIFSPPDCCPVSGYSVADKRVRLSSGLLCACLCSVWINVGISLFLLLCRNKSVFSADMQSVKAEDVES